MADRKGSRGGTVSSVQEAREVQEANREKARWTLLIREHLRATLLSTGYLHADDIAPLGVPEPHCNLIGSQIASYVNRKWMVKVGERKCEHKAANSRKAAIYRITRLGRETLVGVGAGVPCERSAEGSTLTPDGASTDPGGDPSAVRQTAAEGTARVDAGVPRQGVAEGPNRAQVRASVHSGEARGIPPREARPPGPARLFEDDEVPSAGGAMFDPWRDAA